MKSILFTFSEQLKRPYGHSQLLASQNGSLKLIAFYFLKSLIYNYIRFIPVILLLLLISTPASCQRDRWQQPERIMDSLHIQPGMVIGEIGAGEGYFTFKLSPRIGEHGKIYANDIDQDKLDELQELMERDNFTNIIPILGKVDDPCFPDSLLDMVIMVYVFHDLEKPVVFLKNTKFYLKGGAAVVIVDRDPDKYGREYGHFLTKDKVEKILNESDYTIDKIMTFLPRDNIFIAYPKRNDYP